MRILSLAPITEPLPETAVRDVLPHLDAALVQALPVPELRTLIAQYDEVLSSEGITELAVALIVAANDGSQLAAAQQTNFQQFGHNVRSLDMSAYRFSTADTATEDNGDIGSSITRIESHFCSMLHAFPRLSRLIYSGPAIEIDMPHIGYTVSVKWQALFNESGARAANETAVSLLQVVAPTPLTTQVLANDLHDFGRRMQALHLAD